MTASGAEEEASVFVDLGFNRLEHNSEVAVPARPHVAAPDSSGHRSAIRDNDSDESRLARHRRLHSMLPEGHTPPPSRVALELEELRAALDKAKADYTKRAREWREYGDGMHQRAMKAEAALRALAAENWLDADPTDTPFLALAKDHARRALR